MILRQQAFEETGNQMLKGGLHCHTTRSDGQVSPEETIRMHAANGYDFLAITDHRKYNYQNFAPETNMLIIPGMEMDRSVVGRMAMCFHTVVIGPLAEDGNKFLQDQTFDSALITDQYEYQKVLDEMYDAGNLVFYCHPDWSCTPYTSFDQMKGIFAMEIWNSGCAIELGMDTNAYTWDEILRENKHWWGLATDDGHAPYHHCKGWVRVNAKCTVNDVLASLKEGKFYSSTGPEIYDFYVEDGNVTVKCSAATRIRVLTGTRPATMRTGEGMTEVTVPLRDGAPYVRAEISDAEGHLAWTNPIFF